MKPEIFKSLRPMTYEEVLTKLVSQAKDAGESGGAFPRLRIFVGEHLYQGELLKLEQVKGVSWVTIYHRDADQLGADAVSFFPLSLITGLTVGDFSERASFILSGNTPPIPAAESPSKLELLRTVNTVEARLHDLGWSDGKLALDLGDKADDEQFRYRAKKVLELLPTVFEELMADRDGKAAMKSLTAVNFVATSGAQLKAEKKSGGLTFQLGAEANLQAASDAIKKLFEENL